MRRTTRLFELIQCLRAARKPTTAAALAETLEVTVRTIYRDIASLQAGAVPIYGEAGVGYVMRAGYDLPPLMLSIDEVEALTVALSLLNRTGDRGLKAAAASLRGKVSAVLPVTLKPPNASDSLLVSAWGSGEPERVDLALLREAIRDERKLALVYADGAGQESERTVRPIALIYYVEVVALAAWCELRQGFRHFRADRFRSCRILPDQFSGQGAGLRAAWRAESGGGVNPAERPRDP